MSDENKRPLGDKNHVVRAQAPDGTWHIITCREDWLALKARYDAQAAEPKPRELNG